MKAPQTSDVNLRYIALKHYRSLLTEQSLKASPPAQVPSAESTLNAPGASTLQPGENARPLPLERPARDTTEEELQRRFDLFEFAPDPCFTTDMFGTIRAANRAAANLLGVSQHFLIGRPLALYFHDLDQSAFRLGLARMHLDEHDRAFDLSLKPRNGHSPVNVAVTGNLTFDQGQTATGVTWRLQVLEPKKVHVRPLPKSQPTAGTRRHEVSTLSRQLVEAQEKERRAIARELHDEIGQALTGLKLMLETHKSDNLDEATTLVNDLIARLRNMSMDLRPPMLDDLGLLPALLAHFKRFTEITNIRVRFSHADISCRFDVEVESAAYRIIQEALTNVARHANVDSVGVSASADAEWLYIMVSDHGTGFDADAMPTAFHSSGLTGMIERAKLLGGKLDISSRRGQGTRILAHLPILGDEYEGIEDADNRAGR